MSLARLRDAYLGSALIQERIMRHGFSVSLFALISMSSATTVAVAAPAGEAPQREGRELLEREFLRFA